MLLVVLVVVVVALACSAPSRGLPRWLGILVVVRVVRAVRCSTDPRLEWTRDQQSMWLRGVCYVVVGVVLAVRLVVCLCSRISVPASVYGQSAVVIDPLSEECSPERVAGTATREPAELPSYSGATTQNPWAQAGS